MLVIRIPEPMVPLDTHHYHFRTKRDKMRFGVRGAGVNALGPEVATRKTPSPFEPVERARWPHPAAGVWSCGWASCSTGDGHPASLASKAEVKKWLTCLRRQSPQSGSRD